MATLALVIPMVIPLFAAHATVPPRPDSLRSRCSAAPPPSCLSSLELGDFASGIVGLLRVSIWSCERADHSKCPAAHAYPNPAGARSAGFSRGSRPSLTIVIFPSKIAQLESSAVTGSTGRRSSYSPSCRRRRRAFLARAHTAGRIAYRARVRVGCSSPWDSPTRARAAPRELRCRVAMCEPSTRAYIGLRAGVDGVSLEGSEKNMGEVAAGSKAMPFRALLPNGDRPQTLHSPQCELAAWFKRGKPWGW